MLQDLFSRKVLSETPYVMLFAASIAVFGYSQLTGGVPLQCSQAAVGYGDERVCWWGADGTSIAGGDGRIPEYQPGDFDPDIFVPSDRFTELVPSEDSQLIFVSSEGSDNNLGTVESPLRSLDAAYDLVRDDSADWILLRRGDTFNGNFSSFNKNGRSPEEKIVITSYGTGDRPIIQTGRQDFFSSSGVTKNIAIVGLHAYDETRNPTHPQFQYSAESEGVVVTGEVSNILIEDNVIEWYHRNIVFENTTGEPYSIKDIEVRRNIIANAYGSSGGSNSSHGVYAKGFDRFVLEGNMIHHNGWLPTELRSIAGGRGAPTSQNNGVFFEYGASSNLLARNSVASDNIISSSAYTGLVDKPGGIVIDNFFYNNPFAVNTGPQTIIIERNLIEKSNTIARNGGQSPGTGGRGIEVGGADNTGMRFDRRVVPVRDNIVINRGDNIPHYRAITLYPTLNDIEYAYTGNFSQNWINPRTDDRLADKIHDDRGPVNFRTRGNNFYEGRWSYEYENGRRRSIEDGHIRKRATLSRSSEDRLQTGVSGYISRAMNRDIGSWNNDYSAKGMYNWVRQGFDIDEEIRECVRRGRNFRCDWEELN
jgi:hypothetical protein